MGEQVAAGSTKNKNHSKECFIQNGHVPMGLDKGEAVMRKWKERVNLSQQGSAVPYNWFLPVICEFKRFEFAND